MEKKTGKIVAIATIIIVAFGAIVYKISHLEK